MGRIGRDFSRKHREQDNSLSIKKAGFCKNSGGKVTKCLKIFKNVQKLYRNVRKLYRNIQKLHRNVQKYWTFLDADCAAKFSHRFPRLHIYKEPRIDTKIFYRIRRGERGIRREGLASDSSSTQCFIEASFC